MAEGSDYLIPPSTTPAATYILSVPGAYKQQLTGTRVSQIVKLPFINTEIRRLDL